MSAAKRQALGRGLGADLSHTLQRLSHQGNRVLSANLLQTKVIYNFNVRTFVRGIVQYVETINDPRLHRDAVDRRVLARAHRQCRADRGLGLAALRREAARADDRVARARLRQRRAAHRDFLPLISSRARRRAQTSSTRHAESPLRDLRTD